MNTIESLKTAVWIYDIEQHKIIWANNAALAWWHAESFEELSLRDFAKYNSKALDKKLNEYLEGFKSGRSFNEIWQFTPKGEKKQAFCQFSGIDVTTNNQKSKLAMLVEATAAELISPLIDEHASLVLASFSRDGHFQSCNPPFVKEFGDSQLNLQSLFTDTKQYQLIMQSIHFYSSFSGDLQMRGRNGLSWFQCTITLQHSPTDEHVLLCHLYNINDRKTNELSLIKQSRTDALTGLLNRRGLSIALKDASHKNPSFFVFYVDLDGFKMVNDSVGHASGDMILREASKRLECFAENESLLCRFGGDEFVIVIPDNKFAESHLKKAQDIIDTLSKPYVGENENILLISASIGIAHYPNDSNDIDEIIRYADVAMYASKKLGKKRWTCYQHGMEKQILRKSLIAQHLCSAIKKQELTLHYQAIVDRDADIIHSFEALLRWYSPVLGYVNPEELLDVAEDIGQLVEIESWVTNQAMSDLKQLRTRSNSNAKLAINMSAKYVLDPTLPGQLIKYMQKYQLLPDDIIIEITETALLDGVEQQDNKLNKLIEMGICLSIDDFGTGYSSLAYLHNINASIVKIDRAFLAHADMSKLTLKAIRNLINSLSMIALVEGVETEGQAILASDAGISLQQGYLYHRPSKLSLIEE